MSEFAARFSRKLSFYDHFLDVIAYIKWHTIKLIAYSWYHFYCNKSHLGRPNNNFFLLWWKLVQANITSVFIGSFCLATELWNRKPLLIFDLLVSYIYVIFNVLQVTNWLKYILKLYLKGFHDELHWQKMLFPVSDIKSCPSSRQQYQWIQLYSFHWQFSLKFERCTAFVMLVWTTANNFVRVQGYHPKTLLLCL